MYRIFKRKWWRDNPNWPNGLEPTSTARKTTLCYCDTEEEARRHCREWNDTHNPGRYSLRAEYEGV